MGDPLTCAPPRFRILLTDPGDAPPDTYDASGQAVPLTPAHFALLVTLPDGYPASGGPLPTVELEGPVRSNDPLRGALASHLQGVAREEVDATGAGCCYQVGWAGCVTWRSTGVDACTGPPKAGCTAWGVACSGTCAPWHRVWFGPGQTLHST